MLTFTTIKLIAAIVICLIIGGTIGGFAISYHNRGKLIKEQQLIIADYKEQERIRLLGKKVLDTASKKKSVIEGKVPYVEKSIDEMVPSGDVKRAIELLNPYRLRPQTNKSNSPNG